ncbi:MAG: response regulator [Acidobacteriota bacterium]
MSKILVVDDNRDNRNILMRLLEHGGHRAKAVANGFEALEAAEDCRPDLVLMDLAMPEMDGWTATAAFKARTALSEIPIVVVTGHVTADEIDRAQEVGCHDVVSKPIDYYVLMDKIDLHLGRRSPQPGGGLGAYASAGP